MANLLPLIVAVLQLFTLCWGDSDCWDFLVSGTQGVADSALTASSSFPDNMNGHHFPACGRLYMVKERGSVGCPAPNIAGWCSHYSDTKPHIQVEFADLKRIVGVVVQELIHPDVYHNQIRTFHVLFSDNGVHWEYVKSAGVNQTFYGPTNSPPDNTEEYGIISPPVVARFVRIKPLTWSNVLPHQPCLRFDVIGCTHDLSSTNTKIRSRRFAYMSLPEGSISNDQVISEGHAKHLGECSVQCHRDVTCRSFSYSSTHTQCKTYRVNKYGKVKSAGGVQSIMAKQDLYFFDMTNVDLHMTIDETTGLIYKFITRRYSKENATAACEELQMRLFVVNSLDKRNFLQRLTSSSVILEQGSVRVSGGLYEVDRMTKWWDGGDPPQPLNDTLVNLDTTETNDTCLVYNTNAFRSGSCTSEFFSLCEL